MIGGFILDKKVTLKKAIETLYGRVSRIDKGLGLLQPDREMGVVRLGDL